MKISNHEKINYLLVFAAFVLAACVYPSLPGKVASHWDLNGNVNGYVNSFWGAFLMPLIALAAMVIFSLAVRIDPQKANIDKFRNSFDRFVSIFLIFLYYIYSLTLFWAFGHRFNMGQMMAPGMAVVFFGVAVLIKNAEPNWSVGIRTPWTLSSEEVWRKTHHMAARLFMGAAVLCLVGVVFPALAFWLVLVPAISAAFVSVAYSYFVFVKKKK